MISLLPLLTYSAPGGLRQDPGLAAELAAGHSTDEEMGGHDVGVLSMYGGRGDFEPLMRLTVRLRALDAEVRGCAPPDRPQRPADSSEEATQT